MRLRGGLWWFVDGFVMVRSGFVMVRHGFVMVRDGSSWFTVMVRHGSSWFTVMVLSWFVMVRDVLFSKILQKNIM